MEMKMENNYEMHIKIIIVMGLLVSDHIHKRFRFGRNYFDIVTIGQIVLDSECYKEFSMYISSLKKYT